MGGEQRQALRPGDQPAGDCGGERKAVEGGGAAADLVDDHQRVGRGALQDGGRPVISTMKVERPEARSSEAPIRVSTRSIGPIVACVAATKHPA